MSRRSGRRLEDEDIIEQSQSVYNPNSTKLLSQSNEDLREVKEEQADQNNEEDEEDINEEDEVTRCICMNEELQQSSINPHLAALLKKEFKIEIDQGLFIQCDKCHVWQHGYCVGLYENEDVPDKYWCELCKPELHIIVKSDSYSKRTLYKPVNDKRKKVEAFDEENYGTVHMAKPKRRGNEKFIKKEQRKERRHHHREDYDEQLQKALRESAKESGINIEEVGTSNNRKRRNDENEEEQLKKAQSSEENDSESNTTTSTIKKKNKKKKVSKDNSDVPSSVTDKEELIKQNSKPRFVNEKSTIYDLRKRTGAILEWLGRSQTELQDDLDSKSHSFDQSLNLDCFRENLKIMENLTNQIISWEEKFGKYAP